MAASSASGGHGRVGVSTWVADYIVQQIGLFAPTKDRCFVLGCPTGGSARGTYQRLVARHKAGDVSFQHVVMFNIDEYVGVARDSPNSQHSYMFENFIRHVDLLPANVHILDGNAADVGAECPSRLSTHTLSHFNCEWRRGSGVHVIYNP